MQNTKQKYSHLINALENNVTNILKSCINKITKKSAKPHKKENKNISNNCLEILNTRNKGYKKSHTMFWNIPAFYRTYEAILP